MTQKNNEFDIAIIGGGPAGMMAAGRAAELGASVILLEKNKTLGKKLLLTGKGRCNITNAEFNLRKLVQNYGRNGKFLFHAFSVFSPKETINFFEKLKIKVKIERGKRVFPMSNKAENVLKALVHYLNRNKVKIFCGAEVVRITGGKGKIKKITVKNEKQKIEIKARKYILSTGGKSYPVTGSTGKGFDWSKNLGHIIEELRPALVPIKIKESWVKNLQGLSLKNVEVSVKANNKIKLSEFGECLFTHFGLSGPVILNISKEVGDLISKNDNVKIFIDLKPALSFEKLDQRIQRDLEKYSNRVFKNSLNELLPQKLIPIILKFSEIDPDKKSNNITRAERHFLVKLIKNLEMTVDTLMGFDSAIVTTGGVSLKEINDKTMNSKVIDNLFFAGEIIDVDGPTGGFNLQLSWSTGYLAGESAAKLLKA